MQPALELFFYYYTYTHWSKNFFVFHFYLYIFLSYELDDVVYINFINLRGIMHFGWINKLMDQFIIYILPYGASR